MLEKIPITGKNWKFGLVRSRAGRRTHVFVKKHKKNAPKWGKFHFLFLISVKS